jgi:hypothetical protein
MNRAGHTDQQKDRILGIYPVRVQRKKLALLWQFHESCRKINGLSKEVAWRKPLMFRDFIERLPK